MKKKIINVGGKRRTVTVFDIGFPCQFEVHPKAHINFYPDKGRDIREYTNRLMELYCAISEIFGIHPMDVSANDMLGELRIDFPLKLAGRWQTDALGSKDGYVDVLLLRVEDSFLSKNGIEKYVAFNMPERTMK